MFRPLRAAHRVGRDSWFFPVVKVRGHAVVCAAGFDIIGLLGDIAVAARQAVVIGQPDNLDPICSNTKVDGPIRPSCVALRPTSSATVQTVTNPESESGARKRTPT